MQEIDNKLLPRTLNDVELDKYFLGNRSIKSKRVANLLIATSFGANSILYAAWLGYVMGIWAILIQIAWCLSFILLSRFAKKIYGYTSLHDFLGEHFGDNVRKIAAVCSILGFLYFVGWEIAIAQTGLESLSLSGINWEIIIAIFIIIALLYTSINGRKLVSVLNTIFNIIKFSLLTFIVITLGISLGTTNALNAQLIIPNFSVAIAGIGVMGLITNLVFNLSWQFVDNSSWLSINSNSSEDKSGVNKSLFGASGGVFLTVALLGTLLGTFLRVKTGLDSNNILGAIVNSMQGDIGTVMNWSIVVLLLLSMISLMDGISLSVAQSVVSDLGLLKQKYIENKPFKLNIARIITILMGVLAAWGVQIFLKALGVTIFDFVYILIVLQLSLLGAVVVGLIYGETKIKYMWMSIVASVTFGLITSTVGTITGKTELLDMAGTISAVSSIIIAFIINYINKCRQLKNTDV